MPRRASFPPSSSSSSCGENHYAAAAFPSSLRKGALLRVSEAPTGERASPAVEEGAFPGPPLPLSYGVSQCPPFPSLPGENKRRPFSLQLLRGEKEGGTPIGRDPFLSGRKRVSVLFATVDRTICQEKFLVICEAEAFLSRGLKYKFVFLGGPSVAHFQLDPTKTPLPAFPP